MHCLHRLHSKTSPIGSAALGTVRAPHPNPAPDRAIGVGVLSRLPFTTLDPGRRSRTNCESFSKATGTPTRYRHRKTGAAGKTRAARAGPVGPVPAASPRPYPARRSAYVGRVPSEYFRGAAGAGLDHQHRQHPRAPVGTSSAEIPAVSCSCACALASPWPWAWGSMHRPRR